MKTEIIQCFIQFQYLLPNSMLTFLFLRVFTGSQKTVLFPSYHAGKLLSTQATTIYTPSTTRDPRPAIISGRFAALSFCTRTGCRAPWEAVASSGHWVVSGALLLLCLCSVLSSCSFSAGVMMPRCSDGSAMRPPSPQSDEIPARLCTCRVNEK